MSHSVFCEHPRLLLWAPQELLCTCLGAAESGSSRIEPSYGTWACEAADREELGGRGGPGAPASCQASTSRMRKLKEVLSLALPLSVSLHWSWESGWEIPPLWPYFEPLISKHIERWPEQEFSHHIFSLLPLTLSVSTIPSTPLLFFLIVPFLRRNRDEEWWSRGPVEGS